MFTSIARGGGKRTCVTTEKAVVSVPSAARPSAWTTS